MIRFPDAEASGPARVEVPVVVEVNEEIERDDAVRFPATYAFPCTAKREPGVVVPIPILPDVCCTRN